MNAVRIVAAGAALVLACRLGAAGERARRVQHDVAAVGETFRGKVELSRYAFECGRWAGARARRAERRRILRGGRPQGPAGGWAL